MDSVVFDDVSINEIVDFVMADKLFSDPADLSAIRAIPCCTLNSFDLEEVYRYQDPDAEDAMIESPMNWTDIVGESDKDFYSRTSTWKFENHLMLDKKIQSIMNEVRNLPFQKRLKSLFGEDGAGDLNATIDFIIRHRAVCGIIPNHLTETLWKIMKLGGFPCGWCGGKNGMLAVYVPPQ